MTLYRVDIERALYVVADGDEQATDVALRNESRELFNDPESVSVREVTSLKDVPKDLHHCWPYGQEK